MADSIAAALADATRRLAATSPTPRLDAELLMAHALGIGRDDLLLGRHDGTLPDGFVALIARRLGHEPVAYLTGTRAFWTIELGVGPGVLVPRADSETLIEAAVEHFRGTAGPKRVLDLGTGSGALLLAALSEWPRATGIGVDISADARAIASTNAMRLGVGGRAEIVAGGWEAGAGRFDLILCNPPYIRTDAMLPAEVLHHEPHVALFGGADGLADYRAIAPMIAPRLVAGGLTAIEIGFDQGETAAALFRAEGLEVSVRQDLAGRDRCLVVTDGITAD